jgi:D-aminoacyl-tRNA deacylase
MRVVLQRVRRASVSVEGEVIGEIGGGFVLLVGIGQGDGPAELAWMAEKVAGLRVFPDEEGRMNRDLAQAGGGILAVSQFTLYGDCRKGRRPSFTDAAPPAVADALCGEFVDALRARGFKVETGRFGAHMQVDLENDGPVTLVLEKEHGVEKERGA